jgi:hypothetical protein
LTTAAPTRATRSRTTPGSAVTTVGILEEAAEEGI